MTDLVPTTAPAPWEQYAGTGMEDIDSSDLRIPRLKIDHKTASFVNSTSSQNFGNQVQVVVLALVKQRTFFAVSKEMDKPPICKSNDSQNGFPQDPFTDKRELSFPWDDAALRRDDHPLNPELGRVVVSCETCKLKDWRPKTHRDNGVPYCGLQHTYAMLVWDGTQWAPMIFQVKSSGLKASTNFISTFATRNRPMFTAYTTITLTSAKQGDVDYAYPTFAPDLAMENAVPASEYAGYAAQATEIRNMLRQNPRPFEDEKAGPGPVATGPANGAPSQAAPNPWQGYVTDNEGNAATVQGEVVQPAPVQAASPVQAAPPAPPAPPVQAAPPRAQAPVPSTPPAPAGIPAAPGNYEKLPF